METSTVSERNKRVYRRYIELLNAQDFDSLPEVIAHDRYKEICVGFTPGWVNLTYASGVLEIAGGLGLLDERTRRVAGIGLVLLLVAAWPANVEMLLDAQVDKKSAWWLALLWTRLPVQLVLIAWVWRASRPRI